MSQPGSHGYGRRGTGPPRWVALWVPVIVSFAIQVLPVLLPRRFGPVLAPIAHPREFAFALLIMTVGPLALIAARRFPGPVVAVTAAGASIAMLFGGQDWPPYIALGFAIVSAIVRGARMWAWISVGAAWLTTLVWALAIGVAWHPLRIAGVTLGILIVFGIGEGLRTRREQFAEYRRIAAERRSSELQAERVRLARELHDVLAHSLSQINVQAGVGLHLMESQPQKAADALASIKLTSKTALDEVRSVLGILRSDGNPDAPLVPEPDLSRLPGLAASVTSQGVTVALDDSLTEPPPAATQLAIYRIVQESLTNVLRHAKATAATVRIAEDGGEYVVTVVDDGTAAGASGPADGDGRGLLGMRERAELLGGSFQAGRGPGGGFRVEARIPMRGSQ
ncbi:MAG TPA: sensor histidine kinase [Terrimesophilobacter sp.]|nr:sensor histidine kinase [Terrimesophilobacter sp.]